MEDIRKAKRNVHQPKHKKKLLKRLIKFGFLVLLVFIVSMVLFIKFDTEAAANFTDDVLRPMLGANNVIYIEKIFFNSSDSINKLLSPYEKQKNPFIKNSDISLTIENDTNLDLTPVASNAKALFDKEGVWQKIPLSLFHQTVMADTFMRPDITRPYAFVSLVQIDMSKLRLFSVAGTVEPASEVGNPGPGVIPKSVQNQGILVAAFDGGFQYKDGQYGMIVGNKTYLPLKNDIATIVGHNDGKIDIIKYEGQYLGNDVSFVRQNCPMLIEDGVVEANNTTNRKLWGRTTTWEIHTWRSGIGITAKGNLVFAIGNALLPSDLANALKAAGAVNAMQLDINPNWVRFNIFNNFTNGVYSTNTIMYGIKDGSYEYLNGDKKDFFYLTKKI